MIMLCPICNYGLGYHDVYFHSSIEMVQALLIILQHEMIVNR